MNVSYSGPGVSQRYLDDDDVSKIAKVMSQIKPFSRDREPVSFKESLVNNDNFARLDADPDLVLNFLKRNKGQYSAWGPYV